MRLGAGLALLLAAPGAAQVVSRPLPALPVLPGAPLLAPRLSAPVLPSLYAPSITPALAPSVFFSIPALPAGRAVGVLPAEASQADAQVLAAIRNSPPRAVVLDYDNTLADRGPDGLSLPPSEEVTAAVAALLERGIPVVLATSRYYEAPGTPFPFDLKPFIDRLPAAARRNLLVSGGVGSELVGFDGSGAPVRLWSRSWAEGEAEDLRGHAAAAAAEAGVGALDTVIMDGQVMLRLPKGDARGPAVAAALARRLAEAGYPYKVMNHREFVYFSRSDKGAGLERALAELNGQGQRLAPADLLVVGDEFRLPEGGDAALAAAVPEARSVSVGDAGAERLPPGVHRMATKGGRGALLLLRAALGP